MNPQRRAVIFLPGHTRLQKYMEGFQIILIKQIIMQIPMALIKLEDKKSPFHVPS